MNAAIKWFPVWGRALLYFSISFFGIMTEKIVDLLMNDMWPTKQRWVGAILAGFAAGLVPLRAYFDGSVQRTVDDLKQKETNEKNIVGIVGSGSGGAP